MTTRHPMLRLICTARKSLTASGASDTLKCNRNSVKSKLVCIRLTREQANLCLEKSANLRQRRPHHHHQDAKKHIHFFSAFYFSSSRVLFKAKMQACVCFWLVDIWHTISLHTTTERSAAFGQKRKKNFWYFTSLMLLSGMSLAVAIIVSAREDIFLNEHLQMLSTLRFMI